MEEEIQSLARFPSENPNPVLRLDSHGTIITANESAKELLQSWSSAIGQVAPEYWCETVTDLLSSGESRDIDVEVNDRLLTFCAKPVVKAGYVNLYGRDITQRANLQKSLKESEEKYRAMVENSPNMIGIFQDGVLKYFNTSAIHALGWTHEEFASPSFDPIENVVAPKSRSLLKENIGKRLRGEEIAPYKISLTRKDGSEIPVEVRGARITYEGKPAVQFSFANVTERKHAEENRSYLAAIVESSDDAIIGKTLDGVITSWNRGAEKLYGYSAEEAKGKPITILIPPDHRDELPKILYQIRKGEHIQHFETQRMRKDGYVVQVSLAVSPIRDSMGEIIGASKIARDITQELLMRKELQETSEREKVEQTTRARLDFILSSSPAITFTGKPNPDLTDFTIAYMSSNVKQILGYDPDDYMVDPNFWVNHLHPEDSDLTRSQLRRVFTDGHVSVEYRFQCKEGTYQWMRDTVDLIKDRDGKPIEVVGASIEINEQKRIEEENTKLNSTLSLSLSEVIDRVEVFSRTREKLRTVPDVTSGLDIILDSMLWNFSLDFGAFIVLDRHENRANIRATKGKDKPIRLDDSYPLGSFVELQDLQTKSVTKVVREGEKSLFDASVVLIIPVLSGKELYGLLVFGKAEQFSVDENSMRILELYAEVVHSFIMERSITVLPTRERARFGRGVADLEPGNLYLVKKEPAKAFEIFVSSVFGNHEGLCITRMYPPTVRSKYGLEKTPIVWLTNEASESERTVQSVQDLSILIMDFLEKAKSSVILLDGLEYILTNSGFDTFIRLIQVLKDRLQRKGGVLVAPILEGAFGPKELALLQRESVTLTE
ncbi:MAG: PAS domain S-box protein [Candidatus Bathyarchaeia archaeon]